MNAPSRVILAMIATSFASPAVSRVRADGEPAFRPLRAARRTGPIAVDGRLTESAWQEAPPFRDFVQLFPLEGSSPSEKSDVRIVYDESMLYIGVKCYDSTPDAIVRPLGRRDTLPSSDLIRVYIDSNSDRRTAALFVLTAGGVQADALVYDDDQIAYDWDAVWEGTVAIDADGWTAEFAIPLAVLRYPAAAAQSWGFGVQREIGRNHERLATMLIPRNGRGLASRLGTLVGIDGIEPHTDLEVAPYTATRMVLRPQFSDPASPRPRVGETVGNIGVDFRSRVGSRLALTGTVNPDFGQVEADQIILNLSNFEYFFPEKRPFFMQALDLFKSVGDGNEQPPQQLFYSRRIGIDSPILGAAKLTGRASDRVQIGLLDAFVAGTGQPAGATEAVTDRRFRWSYAQPLTFAPALAYPIQAPVSQNFLAAVARVNATDRLVFGATGTSALPVAAICTPADAASGSPPARCDARGGDALALDFTTTSTDGEWYGYGQATTSRVEGGPPSRILQDGTTLARGDMGFGSYLRAGRRGGEPWRFDVAWNYATPTLDLTASGFQNTQNMQYFGTTVQYARPSGAGPFHQYAFSLKGWSQWTTDGRGLSRGYGTTAGFDGLFKSPYLGVHCTLDYAEQRYDVREITLGLWSKEGTGIPMERPAFVSPSCSIDTDATRILSASLSGWVGKNIAPAPLGQPWYYGFTSDVGWRPHPRTETKLGVSLDYGAYSLRYAGGTAPSPLVFAELTAPVMSFTLRQLLVLTPRLTFQLYGQLFTAFGRYGPFYAADPRGTAPIRFSDLRRIEPRTDPAFAPFQDPDFASVNFVMNSTLRWEYKPGWILYLVYARNQSASPFAAGDQRLHSLAPRAPGVGPTVDSVLLKLSYLFRG